MAERSKALVLGTSLFGGVGSNPTPIITQPVPVSLVGQDTWFSPMRPGFESRTGKSFLLFSFLRVSSSEQKVILRRPGIKPGSRPWQGRILSLYYRRISQLFLPRIELGTSRVLGERHDQLDHRNNCMEYLGFDPSTSCLLSTHASDCANTPSTPGGFEPPRAEPTHLAGEPLNHSGKVSKAGPWCRVPRAFP